MRSLFQNISHSPSLYTPHKVLRSQLTNPLGALLRNFFQGLVPWVWGLSLGTCFHFSPVSWSRIALGLFLLFEMWCIITALIPLRNVLAIILAHCTRFNRQTDRWSGGAAGRGRSRRIRGHSPTSPAAEEERGGGHLPTHPSCFAFLYLVASVARSKPANRGPRVRRPFSECCRPARPRPHPPADLRAVGW